jgi:hypothetical protein
MKRPAIILATVLLAIGPVALGQEEPADLPPRLTGFKAEAAVRVDDMQKLTQEIVMPTAPSIPGGAAAPWTRWS